MVVTEERKIEARKVEHNDKVMMKNNDNSAGDDDTIDANQKEV